nr:MAG TPA: hypothetical protein [Caudoviricetes sp.]
MASRLGIGVKEAMQILPGCMFDLWELFRREHKGEDE